MRALLLIAVALSAQFSIHAQTGIGAAIPAPVPVPFVGCRLVTQTDIVEPPSRNSVLLEIGGKAAGALAYYGCAWRLGVLAPRGWHCLAVDGSGGVFVQVSPNPIDIRQRSEPDAPAIEISNRHSGQLGDSFQKAEISMRPLPAYKALVKEMLDGSDFFPPAGPYPSDLIHLSVRLPGNTKWLTPAIVGQAEREFSRSR